MSMEPLGGERLDVCAAIVAQAMAGGKLSDHLIDWDQDLHEKPLEEKIGDAMRGLTMFLQMQQQLQGAGDRGNGIAQ